MRLSRLSSNLGYDYETAIFEAIDDSFEAANSATEVDVWVKKQVETGLNYIVADKVGNANLEKVFTTDESELIKRFETVDDIYLKTGMFSSGSHSHITVGRKVVFITKVDAQWKGICVEQDYVTATAIRTELSLDEILEYKNQLYLKFKIDVDNYGTILWVIGANPSTFPKAGFFEEEKNCLGFKRNLRSTYNDKLVKGYTIKFNEENLLPLDVFYSQDEQRKNLLDTVVTLEELLKKEPYMKERIFSIYLPLYKREFGLSAEEQLLKEEIKVRVWGFDSKFYNNNFLKRFPNEDRISFNMESSGAWLYRNGRRIGNPYRLKMLGTKHNTNNGVRIEVHFNPIFDVFFNINVDKNTGTIGRLFENILEDKIRDEYISIAKFKNVANAIKYGEREQSEPNDFEGKSGAYQDDFMDKLDGLDDEAEKKEKLKQRWEQAEDFCAAYLEREGYEVTDMRRNGEGYDFLAEHHEKSIKKYVEVKKIQLLGQKFEFTKGEFHKAFEYKSQYVVFLVTLYTDCVEFRIAEDILNKSIFSLKDGVEFLKYKTDKTVQVNYGDLGIVEV